MSDFKNVTGLKMLCISIVSLLIVFPAAAQDEIIYQSDYAEWDIYDVSQYEAYKENIDDIIDVLDRAIPKIGERLGIDLPLPIHVNIDEGDGWGGWAGGGEVGYTIGCFKSEAGMDWVRGVVIGEVVNFATGQIAAEWPRDWWVNGVWYYPGMVVVDVLKEVEGQAAAEKWETDEHYPTYPTYLLFKSLKDDNGWKYYQDLFDLVQEDGMTWHRSGFGENPSKIRTSYVIAYLSMTAGENLASRFSDAEVENVDSAEIEEIMNTRERLVQAESDGHDVSDAWNYYKNADYLSAKDILDDMGVVDVVKKKSMFSIDKSSVEKMAVYTLTGREIYSGHVVGISEFNKLSKRGTQSVMVRYFSGDMKIYNEKIMLR